MNAAISIHATATATRAAERCLNASRAAAIRTATRLARCCGLVNVSSTPADGSTRRSSKTARLRTRSASSAPVRPSSSRAGRAEGLRCGWMWSWHGWNITLLLRRRQVRLPCVRAEPIDHAGDPSRRCAAPAGGARARRTAHPRRGGRGRAVDDGRLHALRVQAGAAGAALPARLPAPGGAARQRPRGWSRPRRSCWRSPWPTAPSRSTTRRSTGSCSSAPHRTSSPPTPAAWQDSRPSSCSRPASPSGVRTSPTRRPTHTSSGRRCTASSASS